MHWDFRLEVDGTFKSWAIPKGPSTDPREKRLAMAVDDHSLGWGDFEGTIGEGEYGAGPVIVWDRGTYENLRDESMEEALAAGDASFWLEGGRAPPVTPRSGSRARSCTADGACGAPTAGAGCSSSAATSTQTRAIRCPLG